MKRRLLSMALVCTMVLALFVAALPLSATEGAPEYQPDGDVPSAVGPSLETMHGAFGSAIVPFVDYITNTIFSSYDVENPNESIIWQYIAKRYLDEFRDYIRIDDEYIEYIDEKYYIPVGVFEKYVAMNFVVSEKLFENLHRCEAYTLDGDEYVYYFQYYGGSGGPRDAIFYHGYKQLADTEYALYAYTVDMMEPIPEEDMGDMVEGVDYVTIEDEYGIFNYYITGDYEMIVEYAGGDALCKAFDTAEIPVLQDTEIIVYEEPEPEPDPEPEPEPKPDPDPDPDPEPQPTTPIQIVSPIYVDEDAFELQIDIAGCELLPIYQWFFMGECDMIINLPDEGYENFEYHGTLADAIARFFPEGTEYDVNDSQGRLDRWQVNCYYQVDVTITVPGMEKPIDLRPRVYVEDTVEFKLLSTPKLGQQDLYLSVDGDKNLFAYFNWGDAYVNAIVGDDIFFDVSINKLIYYFMDLKGEKLISYDMGDNQSADNLWTSEEAADGELPRVAYILFSYYNEKDEAVEIKSEFYPEVILSCTADDLKIDKIDVPSISYYEGDEVPDVRVIVTLKNGCEIDFFTVLEEQPTATGKYTVALNILGSNTNVNVSVTVKEITNSGKCGDTMEWSFDETTGTLTISGTGAMYTIADNYKGALELVNEPLWWRFPVKHIVVESGVEYLADYVFCQIKNGNYELLETIQLPKTLKALPEGLVFSTKMESLTIPEGIKSVTGWVFGVPMMSATTLKDLYIPSTVREIDIITIVLSGLDTNDGGLTLSKIHFCGTEEEWNAIERVMSPSILEIFGISEKEAEEFYKMYEEYFNMIEVVFEPKEEIKVDENGTATLPDSVVDIVEGEDIVIDVTAPKLDVEDGNEGGEGGEGEEGGEGGEIPAPVAPKVESVVIGSATVDKIVDANTNVEIKLPDATVSFDADAFGSIGEQAAGKDVTIVVKEVEKEELNNEQKEALVEKEVVAVINLEAIVENTNITEFGGGKVTVSVPFEIPEGKDSDAFYVAYIADDGTITVMPTTYEDGKLCFQTTHFSSYAVLEKTEGNPETGDNTSVLVLTVLFSASLICLAVVNRRRANAR